MNNSITVENTIRNEANRVIAALNIPNSQLIPEVVEATLESLKAIAEELSLPLAMELKFRLVAIRNNIKPAQLREVA